MKKKYLFVRILLVLCCTIYGNSNDTTPHLSRPTFVQMQYAGNMGLVSVGVGKNFYSEKLSVCLIYGYLPERVNEVSVHTIALKTHFSFFKKNLNDQKKFESYIGATILRGITRNTYLKLPNHFPDDYYPPNAYHFAVFTGTKHTVLLKESKWFDRIALFAEIGTIDYELWYGLKTDYIGFFDLWNVSFGFSLRIANKK